MDPAALASEDAKLRLATLVIADVHRLEQRVLELYEREVAGVLGSFSDPTDEMSDDRAIPQGQ